MTAARWVFQHFTVLTVPGQKKIGHRLAGFRITREGALTVFDAYGWLRKVYAPGHWLEVVVDTEERSRVRPAPPPAIPGESPPVGHPIEDEAP